MCRPDDDVRAVARRMVERGIKHMPVVQAGRLVGIVSRHDLLRTLVRPDGAIATEVQPLLSDDANLPDASHISVSVHEGVVTLEGDVRYDWDVPIVVEKVRDVPGVIDIDCRLRNREPHRLPPVESWMLGGR